MATFVPETAAAAAKREAARAKLVALATDMYGRARPTGRGGDERFLTDRQYDYLLAVCQTVYGRLKDDTMLSMPDGYVAFRQFGRTTIAKTTC